MSLLPDLIDSKIILENRVAIMTFCRDDVRNALTGTNLIDDILKVVEWANNCEEVSVLVFTGLGKAFSSGGNVKDMRSGSKDFSGKVHEIERRYRYGIQRIPKAINSLEMPTIAAVNGPAIGAGCDLTCMCDIRLANKSAVFSESFINLGIIPGDGGGWFLQQRVGFQRAAEMTFTGRKVLSQEALDIGLVLKVFEDKDFIKSVIEFSSNIASKPPITLRYTKRLMKMAQNAQLGEYLDVCALFQGACHNTSDHNKAIDGFFKGTKVNFEGR